MLHPRWIVFETLQRRGALVLVVVAAFDGLTRMEATQVGLTSIVPLLKRGEKEVVSLSETWLKQDATWPVSLAEPSPKQDAR